LEWSSEGTADVQPCLEAARGRQLDLWEATANHGEPARRAGTQASAGNGEGEVDVLVRVIQ
jgi:hypothetical protein